MHTDIFAKGVKEILHQMPDNYYKCLLFMDIARLEHMLQHMAGQRDEWFRQQLRDEGAGAPAALEDREDGEEEDEHAPLLAIVDVPDNDLVPPVVQSNEWSRCLVSLPGGAQSKIYFDHSSHVSGRQRGWVDCAKHCCIKYEFCFGNKDAFCTYMHLWRLGCDECSTKKEHLKWDPPAADVYTNTPLLSSAPF